MTVSSEMPIAAQGVARAFDELAHGQPSGGDQQKADVRGGTDQAGQHGPRLAGPDFHHQRHAERPFAPHAQGREQPQDEDLGRRFGESTQAGENGIRQHAPDHGPHAAHAIAEPAKQQSATGRANQERRRYPGRPKADLVLGIRPQQFQQRRPGHERKQAHLQAVEHPTQKCSGQRHVLRAASQPVGHILRGGSCHDSSWVQVR